jgi:hypothetical protein
MQWEGGLSNEEVVEKAKALTMSAFWKTTLASCKIKAAAERLSEKRNDGGFRRALKKRSALGFN